MGSGVLELPKLGVVQNCNLHAVFLALRPGSLVYFQDVFLKSILHSQVSGVHNELLILGAEAIPEVQICNADARKTVHTDLSNIIHNLIVHLAGQSGVVYLFSIHYMVLQGRV